MRAQVWFWESAKRAYGSKDAALGFIKLWGLPLQTQAKHQMLTAGQGNAAPMLPESLLKEE